MGPSQLSCLGSSVGRALCLEYRVSWVRVVGSSPTWGSSFFLGKVTALGVLCCFALFVCLFDLASFFLPSHLPFKNMYIYNTYQEPMRACILCNATTLPNVVAERLSARHPNPASRSILRCMYVSHALECTNVCSCGVGPGGRNFVIHTGHV